MSDGTKIEWAEASWNPIVGCARISAGCMNCYAEAFAVRFAGKGGRYEGLARSTPGGPRWTGELRLVPSALNLPRGWRRPRRIFVNSMSDLFHEALPDHLIATVVARMILAPQHTYLVLTKRAERMRQWFARGGLGHARAIAAKLEPASPATAELPPRALYPQMWLGVSVENQATADARIPELLATPAALRFLSCEPLLGPVDLRRWIPHPSDREMVAETTPSGKALSRCRACGLLSPGHERECRTIGMVSNPLHWVIVGGESGRRARPLEVAWVQDLVVQARGAGVPAFVKQLGAAWARANEHYPLGDAKGAEPAEWPPDIRVREIPEVTRG